MHGQKFKCSIYSLNKYLFSTNYILKTVLGAKAIMVNKIEKIPVLVPLIFWWRVTKNNHEMNKKISHIDECHEEHDTG